VNSHKKALHAQKHGYFDEEIVKVHVKQQKDGKEVT